MRNVMNFEELESRKLFSASASASLTTRIIGPTIGLTAAAATPFFSGLQTNGVDANQVSLNNASLDTTIKLKINAADSGGGVDASHLYRQAIQITNLNTGDVYNGNGSGSHNIQALLQKVKTSGGGDTLILTPNNLWAPNTTYRVEVNGSYVSNNSQVKDVNGLTFDDFNTNNTFTTGGPTNVPTPTIHSTFTMPATQTAAGTNAYTSEAIGPDGKLYVSTTTGEIYRFIIGSDGTLTQDGAAITTIQDNNGGPRIITGIAFDPGSTANNLVLWVSHGQFAFGNDPNGSDPVQQYADNFTGKITRISGPNLTGYQDIVVHIPRSVKDHMNDQVVFDPAGRSVYFCVAAMNAMGQADSVWGNRVENIYSATIMQLRLGSGPTGITTYMRSHGPVDLMIDGNQNTATGLVAGTTHYNIFRGSNPLRIYADGVRNDYDLVFANNGHLYAGINGSSAGGNTPATPANLADVPTQNRPDKDINGATYAGPTAPGLTNVQTIEEDTLLDVKNGAYYGHPNAARGEYILDGANPTSATDPFQIGGTGAANSTGYAVGQQPDRNYTHPIYDFGQDYSPDGMIQYKSVGGKNEDLNNYLLVARYSSGSDVLALLPSSTGAIVKTQERIPGLISGSTGLNSPLDIVEDPNNGNLYIAQLSNETGMGSIVLVKPTFSTTTGTGVPQLNKTKASFQAAPGSSTGGTNTVTLTNTGSGSLVIDRSATKITGTYRKNFIVTNLPAQDVTVAAGHSITFEIKGVLAKGQTSTLHTSLAIRVDGTAAGSVYATVNLRATPAPVTVQAFNPRQSAEIAVQPAVFGSGPAIGSAASDRVISQIDLAQDELLAGLV